MTDVTGFGLLGHLVEMADGAGLTARLDYASVPRLPGVEHYLAEGCVPGGTLRNFDSYGDRIAPISEAQRDLLCDPQTSGGLLVGVAPEGETEFLAVAAELRLDLSPIGQLVERQTRSRCSDARQHHRLPRAVLNDVPMMDMRAPWNTPRARSPAP